MAVAYTGSMNANVLQGAQDGSVRSTRPNTGGVLDPATTARRASLPWNEYGDRNGSDAGRVDAAEFLPPQHLLPSDL